MANGADFYVRGDVSIDASGAQKGVNETSASAQQAAEKIGQAAQTAAATVEAAGEQARRIVSAAAQDAASETDSAARQAAESASASMRQAAQNAAAAGSEMADGLTAGIESAKGTLSDYRSAVAKLANSYITAGESSSDAWKRAYSEIDKSLYNFTEQAEESSRKVEDNVEDTAEQVQQTVSAKTIAIGNLISGAVQKLISEIAEIGKQAVSTGVQYNAQMEQYGVALTTLLGDAEAAQIALANIQADAAVTPFDTASLVQANEFLIAAGENAEYSRKAINALGDAVSATGGGSDELSRMAQNLQQIANAGEATSADVKQFAYAGIDVYGLLADYLGKTTAEVKDMTISYGDLTGALIRASEEGGRFYGAMDTQSQTLNGRLETLKDNASQLAGALTEGLFESEKDLVETAIGWVDALSAALKDEGPAAMMEAAADIAAGIAQGVADNAHSVGEKAADVIASFTNSISERLPAVLSVAADIVSGFVGGMADHFDELVAAGIEVLAKLVVGVVGALPKLVEAAGTAIAGFAAAVVENLPTVIEAGGKILESLKEGISGLIGSLWSVAETTVNEFAKAIESNADTAKNSGSALGQAFGSALDATIVSWLNVIAEKVHQWSQGINDTITAGNALSAAGVKVSAGGVSGGGLKTAASIYSANLKGQAQTEYYKNKAAEAEKQQQEAEQAAAKQAEADAARWKAQTKYYKGKGYDSTSTGGVQTSESSITVTPTVDAAKTTQASKSAQNVETTAEKAEAAMKALGDSFAYTGTAAEEQANRLAVLQAAYDTALSNVEKYKYLLDESIESSGAASEMSQYLAEKLEQEESTLESAKSALDEYRDSLDETGQVASKLETAQTKLNAAWSSSSLKSIKSLLNDVKNLDFSGAVQNFAALAWRRLDAETKQDIVDTAQSWIETLDEAFAADGFSGLVKAGNTIADGLIAGLKDKLPEIGEQLGIDLSGFISSESGDGTESGSGSVSILSGVAQALSSLGTEAVAVIAVIAAAVAAVAGLVALIKLAADRSEEFQEKLESITEPLSEALDSVLEAVQPVLDAVVDVLGRIVEVLSGIISEISEVLAPVFEALAPVLESLGAALQSILDCVGTLLISAVKAIEPVLEAVATVLQPIAELIATLAELISGILSPALEVLGTVINWILTPIKWVANAIKSIFEGIINFINGVLEVLNDISIFGWHPFDFDLIDSPWGDDDGDSGGGSSGGSGSGTISQAYQPIDEVDKYAAAIQTARESALQNAQQSAASLSDGGEEKSSSFFDKMRDTLKDLFGTTQIIVPVEIDGQEFARVTAPYIDEELDART